MCWSIGLMSIFILPVKFPCSVYTVSMQLARRVNFWDAGPEAIGEDMHMVVIFGLSIVFLFESFI